MAFSAVLYGLGAASFAVAPLATHMLHEGASSLFPLLEFLVPDPAAAALNWHALAVSMMVTITVCSVFAARAPVRNKDFAIPVMFSKVTSTLMGLAAFALHARYPAYLVVAVTDFPLFLITWLLWRRVSDSPDD